jgi:homoserine dehydrogenase
MGKQLNVGLLGCGSVGRGLVELVGRNHGLLRERTGVEINISNILVRDLNKERAGVDRSLLTTEPAKVLENGCDLVVELVGGLEPARTFIHRALAGRKHVVTANKSLLAAEGYSLLQAAANQNVRFGFEASVCGGIPIIRALKAGLVGNRIESLLGIFNGTCNYILTRMSEDGCSLQDALQDAQAKGFAEADPALDIEGYDAAQKLKILAELAFHARVPVNAVQVEGITNLLAEDARAAREMGCVIKHVGSARLHGDSVSLEAAPVMLPVEHALAGIRNENNAVLVRGDAVGEMLFSGKGAGSLPSATAVLSDIVEIASSHAPQSPLPGRTLASTPAPFIGKHYVRFPVADPSEIGAITTVFERDGVGVARASASWGKGASGVSQVKVLTHGCLGEKVAKAVATVRAQGIGKGDAFVLRVSNA